MPDPLHPHAVKSAGALQFAHDAVGNQIDRPNETITYTDWDLPRQYIPKAGGTSTTFEYSGTGERVRRIRGESETVYVGDVYEQETNGNTVTDRFYVHNDERVVAIVERVESAETWSFVHADQLGSLDVISNEAGEDIDRRSFDAWGAPRDPKWGGNGSASSNAMTRRGFTWHEGDDDVGLINAKGRIYDPKIARFLQTDPIISNPLDAQTFNPYSYVRNRPLVMTDPSGYDAEAVSVLEYGGGNPGYIAPGQAQMVQDTQRTWLMVWPRESPTPPPAAADHAPSAPEKVGPSIPSPAEQIMVGMGDRAVELGPELAIGFLYGFVGVPGSSGATAKPGSARLDGIGTRTIDMVNQLNPIYAGAMDVVQGAEAHDKGDYVGVGRAGMGFITTVVMTAITLKAGGGNRASSKAPRRFIPRDPDGTPVSLPRGPNGELAPSSMEPHTQIGWHEGRRGGYVQTREFGANGQAIKQVDWTNHGRPTQHTNPHVHDYLPNPSGGTPQHGPPRPPQPGEL